MNKPSACFPASSSAGRRALRLRPRTLAWALVVAGVAPSLLPPGVGQAHAQSLPTGLQVVHGQASVNALGNQMTVTNSSGAILNWQSFSVGASQAVRFNQPNAASKVLNRVVGTNPSTILGSISSNGQVWLLNPYGVLFGANARVDVASLVVSTLNIADNDWTKQNLVLNAGASAATASIVNQGELTTPSGGRVMLIAGAGGVGNQGIINAPDGQVLLAAGKSVQLVDTGLPNLAVQVSAPAGKAVNLGQILAGGGHVDVLAGMVNQQGIVRADSLSGSGGQVVLSGSQDLTVAVGSVTSANGKSGGQVTLDAGSGTASVLGSVQASGSAGSGGQVEVLGRQVGLLAGSAIDASGTSGGGTVLAGGGAQGQDASVPNAQALYMDAAATVSADATVNGDGGHIVLWSDEATRAYGSLSARGGADGGNGGLIETSGGWLDARPTLIDARAPSGKAGTWLLDPNNLTIVDGAADANLGGTNVSGQPDYTTTGDNALVTTGTIDAWLNQGTSVSITTSSAGANTQPGDITMVGSTIAVSPAAAVTLTLNASRNVVLSGATINQDPASSGTLNVTVNAASGGQGVVSVDNSTISVFNGGCITLGGATKVTGPSGTPSNFTGAVGYDGNSIGVSVNASAITTDTGDVDIFGQSVATTSLTGIARGVSITGKSRIQGGAIFIQGWVDTNADLERTGVYIESGTSIRATGNYTLLNNNDGIDIFGTALSSGTGTQAFNAVDIGGSLSVLAADSKAEIFVEGDTYGSANSPVAINVRGTASIDASNAGLFQFNGSGSAQSPIILGDGTSPNSTNPSITLPGTSGGGGVIDNSNGGNVVFNTIDFGGNPAYFQISAQGISGYGYASFGAPVAGTGTVTLQATNFDSGGSSWNVSGRLLIEADNLTLSGYGQYNSSATGDAITLAGRNSGTSVSTFSNNGYTYISGPNYSAPLQTPNGRWVIYATDPSILGGAAAGYPNLGSTGKLQYDATVYNATYGSFNTSQTPYNSGNLLLFSYAPVLTQTSGGSPIYRPYDGTTRENVTNSGQVLNLYNGDQLFGDFSQVNVGTGLPINVVPASGSTNIFDANNKPVYGYAGLGALALTGDINPRTVTLSGLSVATKPYDSTTTASVSASLSNVVSGETLGLTLTGNFASPNAVGSQAVTGIGVLVNGTGTGGALASNYQLSSSGAFTTTGIIVPAKVTLSGATVANKTYDATTTATVSGGTLSGLVSGQTLGVTYSGNFANQNAGTWAVSGTATLTDGTGLASNYTLAGAPLVVPNATITPAVLTLSGVAAGNKVYDGTVAASVSGGTLSGLVGSQTLGLSFLSSSFASKNVANGITVTGTAGLVDGNYGGLASNYQLASNGAFSTSANITPAPLALTGVTATSKTYDTTTTANLTGGSVVGLVSGESLNVGVSGNYVDPNAGTAKTIDGSAILSNIPGNPGLVSNYTLAGGGSFVTTADITPALLTLQTPVTAANKVYDGGKAATLTGGGLTGLLGGQTLGLALSGSFASPNAGNRTVTGTVSLQDGTGLASNYTLGAAASISTSATISPAPLTLSGVTAANKVYDQTTAATVSGGVLSGLVNNETLVITPSGAFVDPNAGVAKAVKGTATLANGTGLASNYTLASNAFTTTATITPAPLTLSSVTAANKVYDSTTAASITGYSVSGVLGNDVVTVTSASGSFASPNAIANQTVTVSGIGLTGAQASDYSLSATNATTTASITPAPLTLSGVTAANKVYDQTTAATVSGGVLSGLVNNETLVITPSGAFVDPNAGVAKAVKGTATLANGTGLASNYTLASNAFTTTATITPAPLTLSSVTAANKVYDSTTVATITGYAVSGVLEGDNVSVASASGTFASPNASPNPQRVTVSGIGLNGAQAADYALGATSATTTATISPALLTLVSATALNKVYDTTTRATVTGFNLAGLIGTQTLGESVSAAFADPNAGVGKSVIGSVMLTNGSNGGLASNYALANGSFTTTATIAPAPLTLASVTAANKVYDSTTAASITGYSVSGVLGNDVVTVTSASGSFASPNASPNPQTVSVSGIALTGPQAQDYALSATSATATATITPASLTLTGVTAANKVYDQTTMATLSGGVLRGLIGNQTLGLSESGAFVDPNAGVGKTVTSTAVLSNGSNGGLASNYTLASNAFTTSATITQAPLTLKAATASDKVYDGTTAATISAYTLSGVLTGDSVSVAAGSGSFADAIAGPAKPVTVTATALGGAAASDYVLTQNSVQTTATITQAVLTYVATPVVRFTTDPLGTFTGRVTGFVADETLAGATTGTLAFTTSASAGAGAGQYAIDGSGLSAINYSFTQAAGNATALTIVAGSSGTTGPTQPPIPLPPQPVQISTVLPPSRIPTAQQGRIYDAVQAVQTTQDGGSSGGGGGGGGVGTYFGAVDLGTLDGPGLLALLEARNRYKQDVFGVGIRLLEADPNLADAPACETQEQLESGVCIAGDDLINRLQTQAADAAGAPGVSPAAPSGSPTGPAAPSASSVLPSAPMGTAPMAGPAASLAVAPTLVAPVLVTTLPVLAPPPRKAASPALVAPPLPAPVPVREAAVPQISRKLAVVIGNDAFIDDRIPWLDNAGRDADAVGQVLQSRLGYQTVVIHDASREAILGALNRLAVQARPTDSVLIYYAGHGVVVDSTHMGYWIPSNANAELPKTWISNNDIDRLIGRIRASQVVLLSDSCFSGSLVSDQRVSTNASERTAAAFLGHRAALVMSSGGNEPVADGELGGHSPFAQSLIDAMNRVNQWEPGTNVFEQVREDVSRHLPQRPKYGPARNGRYEPGADYLFEFRQLSSAR